MGSYNCYGECNRLFESPPASDQHNMPICSVCGSGFIEVLGSENAAEAAASLAESQQQQQQHLTQTLTVAAPGVTTRRTFATQLGNGSAITTTTITFNNGGGGGGGSGFPLPGHRFGIPIPTTLLGNNLGVAGTTMGHLLSAILADNSVTANGGDLLGLGHMGGDIAAVLRDSFEMARNGGSQQQPGQGTARAVLDAMERRPAADVAAECASDPLFCFICAQEFGKEDSSAPNSPSTSSQFPAVTAAPAAPLLTGSNKLVVKMPCCGQMSHESCGLTWLQHHQRCPHCNSNLAREEDL